MKEFDKGLADGEAAASAAGADAGGSATNGRMYVRTQGFGTTDADLRFLQRCMGFSDVSRFARDFEISFLVDELTQTLPDYGMVVDDKDATCPVCRFVHCSIALNLWVEAC